MSTILFDRSGRAVYTLPGADIAGAECLMQSDLTVWSYAVMQGAKCLYYR